MASKQLSVDLILNSMGFKQGIDQAKKGTEDYVNAVKLSDKNVKDLNRSFAVARREAKALTIAFNSLSAAEKETAQGKALQRQMQETMAEAGRLQDIVSDTNAEIRALASDTANLDAFKEAMDIGKSAATAYAGVLGKLTGNEKAMKDMLANITIIQGSFNTAIKVTNALQKQSAIITSIKRLQMAAATKATIAETTATKGATIAQRAFNVVAKANPYVLLATAVLGVATALGTYFLATKKSVSAEQAQQAELRKTQEEWQKMQSTVNTSVANQLGEFMALAKQWEMLKTTEEKNEFLDENKNKFDSMGLAIDDVNELERLFTENTSAVVKALKARAEAEAWGEIYKDRMKKKYEKDLNGTTKNGRFVTEVKAGDTISDSEMRRYGIRTRDSQTMSGGTTGAQSISSKHKLTEEEAAIVNAGRMKDAQAKLRKENQQNTEVLDKWTEAEKKASEAAKELDSTLTHYKNKKGGSTNNTSNEITKLQQLQKELEGYQKQLENIKDPWSDAGQRQVKDLTDKIENVKQRVKDYKIAIGLEIDDSDPIEKQLKDRIKQAEKDYRIAVQNNDEAAKKAAEEAYYIAQNELSKHELEIKIKPKWDNATVEEKFNEIQNKYNQTSENWDFSGLNDNDQKAADEKLNKLKDYRNELKELQDLAEKTSEPKLIEDINKRIVSLQGNINQTAHDLKNLNNQSKENNDQKKQIEAKAEAYGMYGQMIGNVSNALGALGDSEAAQAAQFALNTAAMVADCIKSIATAQAKAIAEGTASGAGLPFPANLAAIASIIATITSIFASLPKFAEGGIVPGSSFYGDKVLSRLNSGERVLTSKQNDRLENMLNNGTLGPTRVIVEGKIRGKDLLLVQKNYNTVGSKTGQSINIF